jgi:hypothetical protein
MIRGAESKKAKGCYHPSGTTCKCPGELAYTYRAVGAPLIPANKTGRNRREEAYSTPSIDHLQRQRQF